MNIQNTLNQEEKGDNPSKIENTTIETPKKSSDFNMDDNILLTNEDINMTNKPTNI